MVFRRLAEFYGAAWLDKWADLNITSVKESWARGLAECTLVQVQQALDALKGAFPPSLPEFRELCRQFRARPSVGLEILTIEDKRRPPEETFKRIHELIGKPGSRGDA